MGDGGQTAWEWGLLQPHLATSQEPPAQAWKARIFSGLSVSVLVSGAVLMSLLWKLLLGPLVQTTPPGHRQPGGGQPVVGRASPPARSAKVGLGRCKTVGQVRCAQPGGGRLQAW